MVVHAQDPNRTHGCRSCAGHRRHGMQRGPCPGRAFDVQPAANLLRAFMHSDETEVFALAAPGRLLGRGEATAVVLDGERHLVGIVVQADVDARRLGRDERRCSRLRERSGTAAFRLSTTIRRSACRDTYRRVARHDGLRWRRQTREANRRADAGSCCCRAARGSSRAPRGRSDATCRLRRAQLLGNGIRSPDGRLTASASSSGPSDARLCNSVSCISRLMRVRSATTRA